MSQVAAKKRLTLRDERVKVIAHFKEEGSVLAGTQKGECEGFTIELFVDGEIRADEVVTLTRLAHQMCFTESTLSSAVKLTFHHFFKDQPFEMD